MRKDIFVAALAIILLNHAGYTQSADSLNSLYKNNTIYRSGNKFERGNTKLNYYDLAREFTTPATQHLYFKSKQLQTTALVCNIVSVGLAVFSTVSSAKQSITISAAATSGLFGLLSIIIHTRSSKFLDKAIWITNGETMFNRNQL
ncbi:MAG: hypothetical protein ABI472_20660 [Ginsengibacter sp.]